MVEPIYHEMAELFSIEESEIRAHAIALRELLPDVTIGVLENALREGLRMLWICTLPRLSFPRRNFRRLPHLAGNTLYAVRS